MTALEGVPATGPADATRQALAGFIDYAGLFPPAALSMEQAVADYRAARASHDAWMLNRFLCPASRLGELAAVLTAEPHDEMFRTRIVFDGDPAGDVGRARAFVAEVHPRAGFDMIEVKWAGNDLDELLDTSFELGRRVLRRSDYEVTADDMSRLHGRSMIGYGSCDFAAPVEALTTAGILPVPRPESRP
ncbi:MAG: hypothetical protein ACR2O6_00655 [Ilumatobacteraceae bacterium]